LEFVSLELDIGEGVNMTIIESLTCQSCGIIGLTPSPALTSTLLVPRILLQNDGSGSVAALTLKNIIISPTIVPTYDYLLISRHPLVPLNTFMYVSYSNNVKIISLLCNDTNIEQQMSGTSTDVIISTSDAITLSSSMISCYISWLSIMNGAKVTLWSRDMIYEHLFRIGYLTINDNNTTLSISINSRLVMDSNLSPLTGDLIGYSGLSTRNDIIIITSLPIYISNAIYFDIIDTNINVITDITKEEGSLLSFIGIQSSLSYNMCGTITSSTVPTPLSLSLLSSLIACPIRKAIVFPNSLCTLLNQSIEG
jgi:hypothetical protein